jgi:NAD(P)-dependent dehydrogenase (short-subunit alcohol dehydrogenase family)
LTEESGEFGKGELEVLPVGCDVSSEESVSKAFAEIKDKFGRIDVSDGAAI